jgi:hypothetical protein
VIAISGGLHSVMFRPWRQDDRPVWRAVVQHELLAPLDPDDREAIRRTALETGMVRAPVITQDAHTISTSMLVKADSDREAAELSARIVEAAHREAAHGCLGPCVLRSAMRHLPWARTT